MVASRPSDCRQLLLLCDDENGFCAGTNIPLKFGSRQNMDETKSKTYASIKCWTTTAAATTANNRKRENLHQYFVCSLLIGSPGQHTKKIKSYFVVLRFRRHSADRMSHMMTSNRYIFVLSSYVVQRPYVIRLEMCVCAYKYGRRTIQVYTDVKGFDSTRT